MERQQTTKVSHYVDLAKQTATNVAATPAAWSSFLDFSARMYKYSYEDQILMYAQRPDATACAEYEIWNRKMNRYVKRGSDGIALLVDDGQYTKLRYVFDITDTGVGRNAKSPHPWIMEQRHQAYVQQRLETMYQVSGTDLAETIRAVVEKKVQAHWLVDQEDILWSLEQSGLSEADQKDFEQQYKALLTESNTYTTLRRCGFPAQFPEEKFADFLTRFGTFEMAVQLGNAKVRNDFSLLRQISQCIQQAERLALVNERRFERYENRGRTEAAGQLLQREERTDLSEGGGLLHSRPSDEAGGAGTAGILGQSPSDLSEGTPSRNVLGNAAVSGAVPPSEGDRQDSGAAHGDHDARTGEGSRSNHGAEEQRSYEVGSADGKLPESGTGDHHGGADLHLKPQAEVDGQFSMFAPEAQQITYVTNAESNQPSAFSFSQEDIDHVLRLGGNVDHHREIITDIAQKQMEDLSARLPELYRGGSGFIRPSGSRYCAWFAEDGIHLAQGSAAARHPNAKVISWEDAAQRISQLLEAGQFATTVELAEAEGYFRNTISQNLWYVHHDRNDQAALYLTCLDQPRTGAPTEVANIAEKLSKPHFRKELVEEYEQFLRAYAKDNDLMRFHYHKHGVIYQNLLALELPRREFEGSMIAPPELEQFITEDELDAAIAGRASMSGGEERIYTFFTQSHSSKEKAEFLKEEYGYWGCSHALSGATGSSVFTSAGGMQYKKTECKDVHLSWPQVAARIDTMIRQGRYLTSQQAAAYAQMQDAKLDEQELLAEAAAPDKPTAPSAPEGIDLDQPASAAPETVSPVQDVPEYLWNYHKGETAYLDDTAYKITEISDHHINLMDPTLVYPITRVENRESFERTLELDDRNSHFKFPTSQEPLVTVIWSESAELEDGQKLPLHQANALFGTLDATRREEREAPDYEGSWYDKTKFRIDFVNDGSLESYEGRQDFGDGDGTLLQHIRAVYESRTDSGYQQRYTGTYGADAWPEEAAAIEHHSKVCTILELHDSLSKMETAAKKTLSVDEEEKKAYATAMLDYVQQSRIAANMGHPLPQVPAEPAQEPQQTMEYRLLDRLKSDCDYFLGAGNRSPKQLWAGDVHLQIKKMRQLYDALSEKPEWLTPEQIDQYEAAMQPPYQVTTYHSIENGFDDKRDYQTLQSAQAAAQGYVDGSMESDGFRYGGAAIYSRSEKKYIQQFGDFPLPQNQDLAEKTKQADPERNNDSVRRNAQNFQITDDHLGEGTPREKFAANIAAIRLLKQLEEEKMQALPEQQQILSKYVGWGGLDDAFDPEKKSWAKEYEQLKELLTPEEYAAARASTLNAHFTSPTIIRAMYDALAQMGFTGGRILEPSMGVGNFLGMLPEQMQGSKLYGVELDSITGRLAQQLYPKAEITIAGFETTDRHDFFDVAIGNVPFGQYQVNDPAFNKLGFSIHNYFFAKALEQVRPGGIVAFVTSRYTMDQKSSAVRAYLAQRAELLGAIRLPNNAFKANAGTEVVSDIIFLQKREHPIVDSPDWVHLDLTSGHLPMNSYFVEHPEMILGQLTTKSGRYGEELTVLPTPGADLAQQLAGAITQIQGRYQCVEAPAEVPIEVIPDSTVLPADPEVRNYSYTIRSGKVYFRDGDVMTLVEGNTERLTALIGLRDAANTLLQLQMDDCSDDQLSQQQAVLNETYDRFAEKYGRINDRANAKVMDADSAYYRLCSLEQLDSDGNFKGKADIFTKRTIAAAKPVDRVDTPSEALAVSIGYRGEVDLAYMSQLLDGMPESEITDKLKGVIFRDPQQDDQWVTSDEYLSGNVRQKLEFAKFAAQTDPSYAVNVEALTEAQPEWLDATEINVRLGATWIDKDIIGQFMYETFDTPRWLQRNVKVEFCPQTAEWEISNKTYISANDTVAYSTYGTERVSAYKILQDTLNLKDIRVYDYIETANGTKKAVLNAEETAAAQQKQQLIKNAFADWIWNDPKRREALVNEYNLRFNSTRPREYDGKHIVFGGINPQITLREHQRNAIAHILYGGNTLLAHEVGAGKTFEMAAAAMESRRLGLCKKPLFVVPNHLTKQWASEFLTLYPSANLLVTTKKDFEPANRRKFCARIATGDYDAIIMGHSQFERIPMSMERQQEIIQGQIDDIQAAIADMAVKRGEHFSIKQMEQQRKTLEKRLEKLSATDRKDDVITFEELGVDRLFVDESQAFKNLFLHTKMRNVAGISTSDAQRSSDMFMKCRYLDEKTGSRGVVFASGTPVSNSMSELYTVQRYLQYDKLQEMGLTHFDAWASTFAEPTSSIELAPEGTGYRARTRLAKFHNVPDLMNLFKEVADIKTAEELHLPVPDAKFETVVVKPSEHQKDLIQSLSQRADLVHNGNVDPSVDNMLKITTDGRKIGLDQRLINPMLPDDPGSKVNACIAKVQKIWQDTAQQRSAQMIFCDFSTPKKGSKFNVYDDIRKKLIDSGIPKEEIAYIHDADTEKKKAALFAKVRSGQVRILLGSTEKMGAGTNCQDRLIALHHLDVPWRPSDMTQRNGRIIRQGNQNKEVQVYQYVTEGTFDAYLYQTLENKQRFISQIMTGKSPVRSCEDVDEQALNYAEIKSLCVSDPRIAEKMNLDLEVSRLEMVKSSYLKNKYQLESRIMNYFPAEIQSTIVARDGFEQDIRTVEANPQIKDGFAGMQIGKDMFTDKEQAGTAVLTMCHTLKHSEPIHLGSYRGFDMKLVYNSLENEYFITLRGAMSHKVALGTDPRGIITRLDNALAGIPKRRDWAIERIDELEKQMENAKVEVQKPFAQDGELSEKKARLTELNIMLDLDMAKNSQTAAPAPEESLEQELPQPPVQEKRRNALDEIRASAKQFAADNPQKFDRSAPTPTQGRTR